MSGLSLRAEARATAAFSWGRFTTVVLWPTLLFVGIVGAAFVGAVITGTEVGAITERVLSLSATSENRLDQLTDLLPLGAAAAAFSAGVIASVNPCGFALLPAYLGLYLGDTQGADARQSGTARVARALLVGSVVTLAFVLLFGIVGVAISLGAQSLRDYFSWIGLIIGVLLAAAGAWLIAGGTLYTALGERLSARMGNAQQRSVRRACGNSPSH